MSKVPAENQAVTRKFDEFLLLSGKADGTRYEYATVLKSLTLAISKPLADIRKEDIIRWILQKKGRVSPEKCFKYLLCLRKFLRWLSEEDISDIVGWIKPSPRARRAVLKELLTKEEVERIVSAMGDDRYRALVMTMYDSAARPHEILWLRISDVIPDSYGFQIKVKGKTGERVLRLTDSVPYLSSWLAVHPRKGDKSSPLWHLSGRPGSVYRRVLWNVEGAVRKAGIRKKVSLYTFRHSRLTELAKELTSAELSAFAGWKQSSRMADVYIHLSGTDVGTKIIATSGLHQNTMISCPRCRNKTSTLSPVCISCGSTLFRGSASALGGAV